MKEQHRAASALKRGGGTPHLSLDALPENAAVVVEGSRQDPEYEFQRAWAFTLLERVLDALENEYKMAGRTPLFTAIRPLLADASSAGYRGLGESLGMSEGAVTVAFHHMRKRYGTLLRAAIADTVADPAELDDELRHLIRIVSANPGFSTLG
jgi:RNA polymerase sigma-70 factor (ECF subfamily)